MKSNRLVVAVMLLGCSSVPRSHERGYEIAHLQSSTTSSMRGVSVVDERIVWTSGTGGTVMRSTDGGVQWQVHRVPNADSLDFRDIEAFDSLTAYVLSAGEDGRIYRTDDGGRSWRLQFKNAVKGAFYDCFDFYDKNNGIAMSDPVDGRYLLIATANGQDWQELPAGSRPQAANGEAAFAASGSCLTIAGRRTYIASGGASQARVFVRGQRNGSFQATPTPVPAGEPAAGIFALAFRDELNGIAIGGNYEKPDQESVVAITRDGGVSWQAAGRTAYTSGAAWSRSGNALIAVGTRGTRISRDRGTTWTTLDSLEYNAVQFANEEVAYAVGPRGRIAKIQRR